MHDSSSSHTKLQLSPEHLAILRETLKRAPDKEENWIQLGNTLFQAGETVQAIQLLQEGARLHLQSAPLRYNIGYMLEQMQEWSLAQSCYQASLELKPDFFEAWFRLGEVCRQLRHHSQATQAFQQAFALRPEYLPCLPRLLEQLILSGDTRTVIQVCELFLQAKTQQPRWYQQLSAEAQGWFENWLLRAEGVQIISFFCRHELDTLTLLQAVLDFARRLEQDAGSCSLPERDWDPERRLKVGYLSNELHSESFYQLFALLFQHQDHQAFEYLAYADSPPGSLTAEVLKDCFDQWHEVQSLSNDALWERFQADQLDILIDMSGLFNPARLPLLARKPAPLMALAGANPPFTSGLSAMDGLFSDPILTPPEIAAHYPEDIWPTACFLHWTLPEIPYEVGEPPCLEKGYMTFGCANTLNKLSEPTLALWARILRALPEARLCLKTPALDDPLLQRKYLGWFQSQGFHPERLILLGALPDQPHIPLFYGQIDIALDPFPYNGGLTSFEALWMGVPVITLGGERRVGASVLTALGLSQWIAPTAEAYFEIALALAQDPAGLKSWRQTLRAQVVQSQVCDGPGFAREREAVYREKWRQICLKQKRS